MGQFKIEITAVGNHGCCRGAKDGEQVYGCQSMNCTDCLTREFVETLKRRGASIEAATITHWPETEMEVVDDLITLKRKGSFPG